MGRDGVETERFSKALFYCSQIPAVSGGQVNGGSMDLPRIPRQAEPLSEPRLRERWLLSELFSALGSVIFFHPWKGNPPALLQLSLRASIRVDRARRWGMPRCLWKGSVSKIDDSMISSEIISKVIDYVTKS